MIDGTAKDALGGSSGHDAHDAAVLFRYENQRKFARPTLRPIPATGLIDSRSPPVPSRNQPVG